MWAGTGSCAGWLPSLRPLARVYEKYVTELARVTDESLRKYGKGIADHQPLQKRIADLIIDLFVGPVCPVARGLRSRGPTWDAADRVYAIATAFTRQARRRMSRNVRAFERNEDEAVEAIAAAVIGRGLYPWDVI